VVSTEELVRKASGVLERHTSRRGFIRKSAIAGSALATQPGRYLLEPVSAYQAICTCAGQGCNCGSQCCDGYTEFCCTITGQNQCPSGTVLGGWWKADGSGYCGGPRYYLDCNTTPQTEGICQCGCANGNCNNRKSCCTRFRYGQCHQELPVLGAIHCRVVTCTPPWQLDATCTTTVRIDQNTRLHDAPCLHEEDDDDMPPAPAVVIDSEGNRWVFVRGTDAALWYIINGQHWTRLGGILTSGPDAHAGPDGRVDVAMRGIDGGAYVISFQDGQWGAFEAYGGRS
jgi:hypothetical protein